MRELRERKPPAKQAAENENDNEKHKRHSGDLDSADDQMNDFTKRFRPKNDKNARAEQLRPGEVFHERGPDNPSKKFDIYVERHKADEQSESPQFSDYQQSDQFSDTEPVAVDADVLSYVSDEEFVDYLEFEYDKMGRTIVPCLTGDGQTKKYTLEALQGNPTIRQQLVSLGIIQEANKSQDKQKSQYSDDLPVRRRDKKAKDKKKKPQKDKRSRAHDDSEKKTKKHEEKLREYERKAIGKDLEKMGNLGILSNEMMSKLHNQEALEKGLKELRQDTVQEKQFSEDGTLEKHIPLEIVDFVGQPPFRGDTSQLQVVVRWKYYDKQNYQPNESKVYYHQLRHDYKRLLIDLFVKKTQLERKIEI